MFVVTRNLKQFCGVLTLVMLTSCAHKDDGEAFRSRIKIQSSPEEAAQRNEGRQAPQQSGAQGKAPRADYFDGSGVFSQASTSIQRVRTDSSDRVSLTFKNTDIRTILQAVLRDTLGLSYVVDPRVQGTATLETSGGISRSALQDTLETLLKTRGYALLATSDGYHVLPLAEAPRSVSEIRNGLPVSVNLPGFAVQVVPLKYTAPTAMQELLAPFAPTGGILRADNERNFLILGGTSQELTSMLRAIETFDVDWMAGMSFALFAIKHGDVDQIVSELESIFAADNSPVKGSIRFIAIPRINKLLAMAPRKDVLQSIEVWVEKLDIGESSPGRRIFVYQVKNGRAIDMADTLNLILGTRYSGGYTNRSNMGAGNSRRTSRSNNRGSRASTGVSDRRSAAASGIEGFNSELDEAGIRIVPNEENNSIMILATPSELAVIESALRQIDVMPRQVLVEVTLAEVTLTDELRYGLQWHFEFGENSVSFGKSAQPTSEFPGFSWGYTNNSSASAVLNALESMTDIQVISSPKLLVLNNQSANLQVGDEVPVPVASAVSTTDGSAPIVNSIEYRTTGVILTVTPRINDGGLIMLDIEQEVSGVVETSSSGIDAPTIQQRRITSTVAVQDGNTIALGGLIRSTVNNVKSGVPLLKDIPLLGAAFSNNDVVERRSELVILMTPRIIRDVQEQREVMDYLQQEFRSLIAPSETSPQ